MDTDQEITLKKSMKRFSIVIFVSLLFGLLAGFSIPALAQSLPPAQGPQPTPSDNQVNEVAKQMYCPVCENIPLDVCPTTACQEWRQLIRQKLADGWTTQQIKEYFAVQYGDRVLAEPPRRGLNWLVYVLPPFFFLIGVGILWGVLRSMRRSAAARSASSGLSDTHSPAVADADKLDPYMAQLEEELRKQKE